MAAPHPAGRIFVSYSHKDIEWLERIKVFLRPLERNGAIDLWSDQRIATGEAWKQEVAKALESADIALLLISSDYLASDFVESEELPSILQQAEAGKTSVYCVILRPSRFHRTPLTRFQTFNPPSAPLYKLSRYQREEELVRLADFVEDRLRKSL